MSSVLLFLIVNLSINSKRKEGICKSSAIVVMEVGRAYNCLLLLALLLKIHYLAGKARQ